MSVRYFSKVIFRDPATYSSKPWLRARVLAFVQSEGQKIDATAQGAPTGEIMYVNACLFCRPDIFNPCSGAAHQGGTDPTEAEHVTVEAKGPDNKTVKIKDAKGILRSRIHFYTTVAEWTTEHEKQVAADAAAAAKTKK